VASSVLRHTADIAGSVWALVSRPDATILGTAANCTYWNLNACLPGSTATELTWSQDTHPRDGLRRRLLPTLYRLGGGFVPLYPPGFLLFLLHGLRL